MSSHLSSTPSATVSRRAVAAGLAWAGPALAVVAAAPYAAASPDPGVAYRFRGSAESTYDLGDLCESDLYGNGGRLTALHFDNQKLDADPDNPTSSPLGFSIVEMPRTVGTGMSPTTIATLESPVQFVVAYPSGMVDVDLSDGAAMFTFQNDTDANWSPPEHTTATMTDPTYGISQEYDLFTFTWLGDLSQSTVADSEDPAAPPTSWDGTALVGDFAVNEDYCAPFTVPYFSNYYAGGSGDLANLGTYTTVNGFTGPVGSTNPATGGWFEMSRVIRG